MDKSEIDVLWRVLSYGRRERRPPGNDWWFDNHGRPPAVVFQYVAAGGVRYRDPSVDTIVPSGSAFLFTQGEDSAYGLDRQTTEGCTTDWISFAGTGIVDHWNALRRRYGSIIAVGPKILASLERLIKLSEPKTGADPCDVAAGVHAFVMDLFVQLRTNLQTTQIPVDQAIDALMRNPAAPWSLKEAAERFGCSREHLARTFSRRLGLSPGQWLARERLRKALQLLSETNLPLAAIAVQAGFSSTQALARQVRSETGKSPRTLRSKPVSRRS
jgi:AraC-like DNA-binding protein